ncbi:hypothetical protein ACFLUP_03395 [Chloroflexota bacterium]
MRWLLVLPAAIFGFVVAQLLTILVTTFLPDVVSQLASSATTPIGFVLLGTRVAPTSRVRVAGVLTILMVLFQGMYLGLILFGYGGEYNPVVRWLALPIGVVSAVAGLYIIYKQERSRALRD